MSDQPADVRELSGLTFQQRLERLDRTLRNRPNDAIRLRSLASEYGIELQASDSVIRLDKQVQSCRDTLDSSVGNRNNTTRLEDLAFSLERRALEIRNYHREVALLDGIAASHGIEFRVPDRQANLNLLYETAIGVTTKENTELGLDKIVRDLDQSIQLYRQVLDVTPEGHPDRGARLVNLASVHMIRYGEMREREDCNLSIQLQEEAIDITPKDSPDHILRLIYLADSYKERATSNIVVDSDRSIGLYQQGLELMTATDVRRADQLRNIASVYEFRFQHLRSEADLDQWIRYCRLALDETSQSSDDQAEHFQDLASAYEIRYKETKNRQDSDECIQLYRLALEMIHKRLDQITVLQGLASIYELRYHTTGNLVDLDQSIELCRKALLLTSHDDLSRIGLLEDIARSLMDRYEGRKTMSDLDQAIETYRQIIDAEPDHRLRLPDRLNNLASLHKGRFNQQAKGTDFDECIRLSQKSFDHTHSSTNSRMEAALLLIDLYAAGQDWTKAYSVASSAVALIAKHTPPYFEPTEKQRLLPEVSGLASKAAAIALMAGNEAYEAVRLLELGRGVILSSMSEIRLDISNLQDKHPQLADEFVELQRKANTPISDRYEASRRVMASLSLDRTIQAIQNLPDFDRFLRGPSENELKSTAVFGPVVIINVSNYRSDALIIEQHGIKVLPLPRLHNSEVLDQAKELVGPESLQTQLLEYLWDTIAEPILEELGFDKSPKSNWPRMWWIPVGPLAKFPIHAAGHHFREADAVLDRVISSYSSSVRALAEAQKRRNPKDAIRTSKVALLVSMEATPGQRHLPAAKQEVNELKGLCNSMKLQVNAPSPRRNAVLSALKDCDIFHFAGHGLVNHLDPLESSLLLIDEPLTVSSVLETDVHSRAPFLAYLSACGTGQIKHDGLIDEALHLISAYQIAGFRHAIGSLWEVNDTYCVDVAMLTYDWIFKSNMVDDSVSEGLHRASIKLRESWIQDPATGAARRAWLQQQSEKRSNLGKEKSGPSRTAEPVEDKPLYWASYIHFGL